MVFDILSLFPSYFDSPFQEGLIGKAIENKKIIVNRHNLREYSNLPHQQVDDTPYGGGAGMVLKADVLAEAVKKIKKSDSLVILTDPAGLVFNQKLATELSKKSRLLLISARYEGVDQRFKDKYVDLEVSIGDFVVNGGEVACLTILEAVSRLLPGVIGSSESLNFESFSEQTLQGRKQTLLEYPQYTKPAEFEGESVPEVLLSGDHQSIKNWRESKALEKTKKLRPDLLEL
jgi:tRNA (guanine37-N1)-methyltransferase